MTIDPTAATKHLMAAEPKFVPLITSVGPFPLASFDNRDGTFHYLLRAIVYQQLSGKAAATIHGRVLAKVGEGEQKGAATVLALPDADLRGAGMSQGKLLAARDLASRYVAGTLPSMEALESMSDDEVVEAVTAVRGVGLWTAQMLLMFRLRRPDVLPATDLGIRKGFAITISNRVAKGKDGLPSPDAILRRGEKWAPWRTVASWYLWRSLETPTG